MPPPQCAAVRAPVRSGTETSLSLKHILIVENDYMVLETLGELLKGLGYRASIAGEGNEARAILSRENVDLLVADELLPGERGHELAEYARSIGVPTLLMSADEEIKRAMERAQENFIGKPFRLEALDQQITDILARQPVRVR
jgi:DNA-binding NtrC family response regulator